MEEEYENDPTIASSFEDSFLSWGSNSMSDFDDVDNEENITATINDDLISSKANSTTNETTSPLVSLEINVSNLKNNSTLDDNIKSSTCFLEIKDLTINNSTVQNEISKSDLSSIHPSIDFSSIINNNQLIESNRDSGILLMTNDTSANSIYVENSSEQVLKNSNESLDPLNAGFVKNEPETTSAHDTLPEINVESLPDSGNILIDIPSNCLLSEIPVSDQISDNLLDISLSKIERNNSTTNDNNDRILQPNILDMSLNDQINIEKIQPTESVASQEQTDLICIEKSEPMIIDQSIDPPQENQKNGPNQENSISNKEINVSSDDNSLIDLKNIPNDDDVLMFSSTLKCENLTESEIISDHHQNNCIENTPTTRKTPLPLRSPLVRLNGNVLNSNDNNGKCQSLKKKQVHFDDLKKDKEISCKKSKLRPPTSIPKIHDGLMSINDENLPSSNNVSNEKNLMRKKLISQLGFQPSTLIPSLVPLQKSSQSLKNNMNKTETTSKIPTVSKLIGLNNGSRLPTFSNRSSNNKRPTNYSKK